MSKPATTEFGKFNKDPINEVHRFLDTHHKDRYKIFDLCVYDLAPLSLSQMIDYESFGYTYEQFDKLTLEQKRKLYEKQVRRAAKEAQETSSHLHNVKSTSRTTSARSDNMNDLNSNSIRKDAQLLELSLSNLTSKKMSTTQLLQLEQRGGTPDESLHGNNSIHITLSLHGQHQNIDKQWDKNDGKLAPEYHKYFPISDTEAMWDDAYNACTINSMPKGIDLAQVQPADIETGNGNDEEKSPSGTNGTIDNSKSNTKSSSVSPKKSDLLGDDDWILTHKYGFRGHGVLSLEYILDMCEEMHKWLEHNSKNVVIIQSPSGIDRSLFICCCLLFYYYPTADLQDVVTFTRNARIKDTSKIEDKAQFTQYVPSQTRFYQYFATLMSHCYATSLGEHIQLLRAKNASKNSFRQSIAFNKKPSNEARRSNNKSSMPTIPSSTNLNIQLSQQDSVDIDTMSFDPELEAQLTERIQSSHEFNKEKSNSLTKKNSDNNKSNDNKEESDILSSLDKKSDKKNEKKMPSLLRIYNDCPIKFLSEKIGIFIHRITIGPLYKEMDPYAVWEVDIITFNKEFYEEHRNRHKYNNNKKQTSKNSHYHRQSLTKENSPSLSLSSSSNKSNKKRKNNSNKNKSLYGIGGMNRTPIVSRTVTGNKSGILGSTHSKNDLSNQVINVQPYCSVYEKYLLGAVDIAGHEEAIIDNNELTKVFENDFALRLYHVNNDHRKFRGQIWLHSHFLKYDKGSKKHSICFTKNQVDEMSADIKNEKFPADCKVTMIFTILKKK